MKRSYNIDDAILAMAHWRSKDQYFFFNRIFLKKRQNSGDLNICKNFATKQEHSSSWTSMAGHQADGSSSPTSDWQDQRKCLRTIPPILRHREAPCMVPHPMVMMLTTDSWATQKEPLRIRSIYKQIVEPWIVVVLVHMLYLHSEKYKGEWARLYLWVFKNCVST